ncbi:hypothetical protein IGI67_002614 [Enterococcus sp. AZ196]
MWDYQMQFIMLLEGILSADLIRVSLLRSGKSYIEDISNEQAQAFFEENKVTETFESVGEQDVVIIDVPTPNTPDKQPNLSHIQQAVQSIIHPPKSSAYSREYKLSRNNGRLPNSTVRARRGYDWKRPVHCVFARERSPREFHIRSEKYGQTGWRSRSKMYDTCSICDRRAGSSCPFDRNSRVSKGI